MSILVINDNPFRLWGEDYDGSEPEPKPQPDTEYSNQYLTFENLSNTWDYLEFIIPKGITTDLVTSVSYSVDDGRTWTTVNNSNDNRITVNIENRPLHSKVLFKGIAKQYYYLGENEYWCYFNSDNQFKVYGNIMSMIYGDDFADKTVFPNNSHSNFKQIFKSWTSLIDSSDLILPATILTNSCYNCMFYECTGLETAPELPATTLSVYCYCAMFWNCTSLTSTPELPATTLSETCYQTMFYGCLSLNYIKMLATDISATNCLNAWVNNVAATGTFVKTTGVSIPTGVNGIPSGWTVEEI